MGRAKVPMKLVMCERSRNRVFQNRRKGLAKKCKELSVLCGIDVCMISLGPQQGKRRFQQETYPTDEHEVKRIIQEFRRRTEKGKDNGKNHCTLAGMLRDKKIKLEPELELLGADDGSSSKPPYSWDDKLLDGMSEESLREVVTNLDAKLSSMRKEIELHNAANNDVVGKTTEPADPQQWNHAPDNAMVEQIGTGWEQIQQEDVPYLTMDPYGGNVCDIMEIQQVQPETIWYQGVQYPYETAPQGVPPMRDYYYKMPGNCMPCKEDTSFPLPATDMASSSYTLPGSCITGFDSLNASFDFPYYYGGIF